MGILGGANGASSVYRSVPMQRFERDIQALNLLAILRANNDAELCGRMLCGLEPNTFPL